MRTIGNILWFIFGGLLGGLAWIFAGCIWCITIIGIPVGLQCFKFATLAFWPFGKEIVYGNGMFSFLVNLIWIIFFGWEMALGNLIVGCIWCINIGVQINPEQETVWLTQKYCLMLSICSSRSLIRNLKISQTVRLRKVTKMP